MAYLRFFGFASPAPSFLGAFVLAGADLDAVLEAWKPFVMDCFLVVGGEEEANRQ